MQSRDRALEILRQARDHLVERMCERIVASEEAILEDASGYTFAGEIESLYDQLGGKLQHVTSMLSTLQSTTLDSWTYLAADGQTLHAVAMASAHAPYVQTDTAQFGEARPSEATGGIADRAASRELPPRHATHELVGETMDKKAKKRIDVLNQKLQKLRQLLSAAKQQPDEPDDITRLEREIEEADAELHKLKQS